VLRIESVLDFCQFWLNREIKWLAEFVVLSAIYVN